MLGNILRSNYIIDGIQQPLTPEAILRECALDGVIPKDDAPETLPVIADETIDPAPSSIDLDSTDITSSLKAVSSLHGRCVPGPFAGPYTAEKIAGALIDTIWMGGHFRLGDLTLKAEWKWNGEKIGNMAAFYASVEAAGSYIDSLGLRISSLGLSQGACSVSFKAVTTEEEDPNQDEDEEGLFGELPFRTASPRISRRRKCPATILPERSDWLVYVPFDSCDFRLGGSALEEATSPGAGTAPEIGDADYFIDCFEVVRELVEDGVVRAGASVGNGGLMTALSKMAESGAGASISIGDICRAYGNEKPLRVLFSEVPGVILQIADIDYDYIDAEFLLQDIAYFPLGHPDPSADGISVIAGGKTGIGGILDSLLGSKEGED